MNTERDRNALVVKSNALVPSLAKLELMELRFLAYCISKIEPHTDEFCTVTAKASDVAKTFNISPYNVYGLIKSIIIRLNSKPAEYQEELYQCVSVWFTTFKYKDGEFIFKFNNDLINHLLQLKDNFTTYRIRDVYQFKSAITWHVYEVLRQYKNQKTVEFDLDRFRILTDTIGQYSRFNNFKARIIDGAIEDINKYSDIEVQYDLIKRGAKVIGLRFHIIPNCNKLSASEKIRLRFDNVTVNHLPELAKKLRDEARVGPKQAKQIANLTYHNKREDEVMDMIPILIQRYNNSTKKSTIGGYVFQALKNELTTGKLIPND